MPPLQALAALHALWFVALIPLALLLCSTLPLVWLRAIGLTILITGSGLKRSSTVGRTILILGLLGLAGVAVYEAVTWLPQMSAEHRRYLPHRFCFVLATQTDVPFVQVCVAGLVCWLGARRRRRRLAEGAIPIVPILSSADMASAPMTAAIVPTIREAAR